MVAKSLYFTCYVKVDDGINKRVKFAIDMRAVFFILGVFVFAQAIAQEQNFWPTLAQVQFQNKKDKSGYDIEVPVFSKYLKTFQGKRVKLKGYIIPLEELGGQGKFMLSSLPFNLCYFCGAAGPETVVEVESTEKVKFTTKPIWMEGTLVLNDSDPEHHIYILKSARLVD